MLWAAVLGLRWALLVLRPTARDPFTGAGMALSGAITLAAILGNVAYAFTL